MRFSSLRSETTVITRALSCVAAAGFALALAGPASAAGEPQGGSIAPAPQGAQGQMPQQAPSVRGQKPRAEP